MTDSTGSPNGVETPVVIVGAGPAGLAIAACLRRAGVDFELLERADAVGSSWRRHYDRLHLHTIKQCSALPHHPFPRHYPMYPSRQQVVDYLDDYARTFGLEPRFGTTVTDIAHTDGRWRVQTDNDTTFSADRVVVATGYSGEPKVPDWPGADGFSGEILHASRYRNGRAFRGRHVLVVGLGNSGGEMALDLFEHGARVTLAVRSPVHVVPREFLGLPAQLHGIAGSKVSPGIADAITLALLDRVVGDLSPWGLRRPDIGPVRQLQARGRVPLIDIGTVALVKQGAIAVIAAGIERFDGDTVAFTDGQARDDIDAVLCATGYRPALDRFFADADALTDARGYPTSFGADSPRPGLHFIGFRNPITGQLRDIRHEALAVAEVITGCVS